MKRASWDWLATKGLTALHALLGLMALALLAALAAVLWAESEAPINPTRFDQAMSCLDLLEEVPFSRAGMARLLDDPRRAEPACWHPTSLPLRQNPNGIVFATDRLQVGRVWFRVQYEVPVLWNPSETLMIYAPRMFGTAWRVEVNGHPINDDLDDWRMTWNLPVHARVPPQQFQPGQVLDIRVGVAFSPQMGYSAARITVGPASVVSKSFTLRQYLQVTIPQASGTGLLLLGSFFFAFWLSRRNETAHLLVALAALAWGVCNLQYFLPRHDSALLEAWYSSIVSVAVCWYMWLIYLMALRFDSRRLPWLEHALPVFVAFMSLVALPGSGLKSEAVLLFHGANGLVAFSITALICYRAVRGGSLELRLMAAALLLALVMGIHDLALLGLAVHPESIYLLPYGSLLVFGSFLFGVQQRYVGAIESHERLSASLASQLAMREAELNAKHQRLLELERRETLANERERLKHDMHDGIGSALLTALAAVESDAMQQTAVARILRNCIDDLRLVIDSLEPMENDLVTLLGTIRYRLGPQLEAAGLTMQWEMQDLPKLGWLEVSDRVHVLRIVQEALANALKHSDAREVRVSTSMVGGGVQMQIADNGCGFDTSQARTGRGLKNLRRRAEAMQGQLSILSARGGGCVVTLWLPIERRPSPA